MLVILALAGVLVGQTTATPLDRHTRDARQSRARAGTNQSWGSLPALASAATIATVADIALSRHCVAVSPACREANPLLPRNAAATWAIEAGFIAGMTWMAHRLHRRRSKLWAVPMACLIAAHALGTTSAALTLRQRR